MSLESYLPEAEALYESWCERLRVEAEQPGGVGRKNVHCCPWAWLPGVNQLRLAEIVRDRHEEAER